MPFIPEDQPVGDDATAASDVALTCWRCGLAVGDDAETCPHCAARLVTEPTGSFRPVVGPAAAVDSFNLLFCTYVALLAIGLIHAYVLGVTVEHQAKFNRRTRDQIFTQMLVV